MRAAVYEEFNGPITIQTVEDPTPSPDGVVVEVKANGICRSDWHAWVGHSARVTVPHIPGHECAGLISAIGSGVKRWKVGDRVIVPFSVGCGACPQCFSGHSNICDNLFLPGFSAWGSFAEYVAIDHADGNLVSLPETVEFVDAASLGCRFMTAFWSITERGRVRPGDWLAVHGCGGVGLAVVMIGKAMGASVVAVDIDEAKLSLARDLGASAAIDANKVEDVPSAIRDATGGGADVSVDALGSTITAQNSIRCLKKRGRHIQIGLLFADDATPPIPLELALFNELEIVGSFGMPSVNYPQILRIVSERAVDPGRLVTGRVSLEEACDVLPSMGTFSTQGVVVIDRF